jgi:hypothetical protein
MGNRPYIEGEAGPELFVPNTGGSIVPNNKLGMGSMTINITILGAGDPEATGRAVGRKLLQLRRSGALDYAGQ